METLEIFGLQLALSLLVLSLLAAWRTGPWLDKLDLRDALFWLTLPHAFRHLGMVFLVPGVVAPTLPDTFAIAAAYGDLAAGLLAIITLVALHRRWSLMILLAWLLTVVGTLDLANALSHAEAVPHLHAAWYIPTFVVPVLLVTHFMTFTRLAARLRSTGSALANE